MHLTKVTAVHTTKHSFSLVHHLYQNQSLSSLACFTPSTSGAFFKLWPFSKHYMEQCLQENDLTSVNVTDIPSIAFKMMHYTQGKGGVNYTQFLSISLCQQEFGQRVLLDLPICVLHTHMLWRDCCPLFCFYHHCFRIHQSKSIEVAHCKVQTEWLQLQHKLCFSA